MAKTELLRISKFQTYLTAAHAEENQCEREVCQKYTLQNSDIIKS